jgi:hypothetical protein
MHRATVVFVCLIIFGCFHDTEKKRAEEVNDEKFQRRNEKEAHFVLEVLDTSYGLIDLAKIGELRIEDPDQKEKVKQILQSLTSAMIRLKTYAEEKGIVIPFSGPDKTKRSVKKLEEKDAGDFRKAWVTEMKELQHRLKTDIEGYQRKSADTTLLQVLDSTLIMVKSNNELISDFETSKNNESI